jgi:hypothetical protein
MFDHRHDHNHKDDRPNDFDHHIIIMNENYIYPTLKLELRILNVFLRIGGDIIKLKHLRL